MTRPARARPGGCRTRRRRRQAARAVAIACRPATPAPITSTLAGATVPAAVISMGKNFGSRSAASSTALYPPTVLCEDKASIDCARVMRGIDSIAKPTIPRSDRRSIPSLSVNGSRKEISATPSGIAATSSAARLAHAEDDVGARIQLGAGSNRGPCLAVGLDPRTRRPRRRPIRRRSRARNRPGAATVSGTSATRRSPAAVSLGTATFTARNSRRGGAHGLHHHEETWRS